MNYLVRIARKFWCLEGFVAIIFTIFTISALMHGSFLMGMLMAIFSYWWIKRVIGKPSIGSRGQTNYFGKRDIDL